MKIYYRTNLPQNISVNYSALFNEIIKLAKHSCRENITSVTVEHC